MSRLRKSWQQWLQSMFWFGKVEMRPGSQKGKEIWTRVIARWWLTRFYDPITMRKTESLRKEIDQWRKCWQQHQQIRFWYRETNCNRHLKGQRTSTDIPAMVFYTNSWSKLFLATKSVLRGQGACKERVGNGQFVAGSVLEARTPKPAVKSKGTGKIITLWAVVLKALGMDQCSNGLIIIGFLVKTWRRLV